LSPARRAILDVFIDRIAKMNDWPSGICDPLRGRIGFWELRWTAEKVEHRILGYHGSGKEFIMLIGCTHKGRVYNPAEVFDTMVARRAQIESGQGRTSEYRIVRT
jgi:hypothetical protein